MSRNYYDDFTKMPVDKMAQSIVDMTFSYQNTVVPKKHYKEILETNIMDIASQDINIEFSLLKPYFDMISQMSKENRKYFVKALLIHELKLKYSTLDSQNIFALSATWDFIEDNRIKQIIDEHIVEVFKEFKMVNNETQKKDKTN